MGSGSYLGDLLTTAKETVSLKMLLVLLLMFGYSYYENKVVRLFLDGGIRISSVKYGDNSKVALSWGSNQDLPLN